MVNPDHPNPHPALVTLSEDASLSSPEMAAGKPSNIFLPISISTPSMACLTEYLASLYLPDLNAASAEVRFSFTLGGVDIRPSPPLFDGLPLLPTEDISGLPELPLPLLPLTPTASSIFLSTTL